MNLLKYFDNKTIGFKISAVFVFIILIPMAALAFVSYRITDSRLEKDARDRLQMGIESVWTEYYARSEQMRYGMIQAAVMPEIRNAIKRGDSAYLRDVMERWKQGRPYVDVWGALDSRGRLIAVLGSDSTGGVLEMNGMVKDALRRGVPRIATEILSQDELNNVLGGASDDKAPQEYSEKRSEADILKFKAARQNIMGLFVVTPVLDNAGLTIGAIVTGDIINHDAYIPDVMAKKISGLFTGISAEGVRITTNLADGSGHDLVGTKLPQEVTSKIGLNASFFTEVSVADTAYIAMFEPIMNYSGAIIGSIDVAFPKQRLWAIQRDNQKAILIITLIGLAVSLGIAFVSTHKIAGPVRSLKDKLKEFASGNLDARISVDAERGTKDEIKTLALAFNSMMDEVGEREREKAEYMREIEEKSVELKELNEEYKKTNEELEVAYEETQSQTEELLAINEELKLLNEDLDRKNLELKRANSIITMDEEEIRRAKEKLRLIYDSISDYILLVDRNYRIFEANRHFMERHGLAGLQSMDMNLWDILKTDAPTKDCPIRTVIDQGAPRQAEFSSKDGRQFRFQCFPYLREDLNLSVVHIEDITEEKFLAERLMQSEKLSSIGELVSGVAHELNNPLTGIMCFSELMTGDAINEGTRDKARKINDAAKRCKRIIDNLLTFARWKTPEKKYENVNKVIRSAIELRAYQFRTDNIDVAMDLQEPLPLTMLDEGQMQQVFLNMINNARDAIAQNGKKRERLLIKSRLRGASIAVSFEDTGKGMAEDVVKRIFEPFFTTKGVGEGTGLGLSISYGIIKEHGGNISVVSAPGSGTTFTVELPVVTEAAAEGKEASMPESQRLNSVKIAARGLKALVMDDEEVILEILDESLKSTGFKVHLAGSVQHAINKITENDYDIILSDIKMPGMDGKDFYWKVKEIKPKAMDRILFISGDNVNKDTLAFLKSTGKPFLSKPFTVDELHGAISKVLFPKGGNT